MKGETTHRHLVSYDDRLGLVPAKAHSDTTPIESNLEWHMTAPHLEQGIPMCLHLPNIRGAHSLLKRNMWNWRRLHATSA